MPFFVFGSALLVDNLSSLLDDVKSAKPLSFDAVYSLYLPLMQSAVAKCMKAYGTPEDEHDDLFQEAAIALYKAALSFDTGKGTSFGLYAKICIQHRITSFIRGNKKSAFTETVPYEFYCDEGAIDTPESLFINKESIGELNKKIDSTLTEFESSVFRLYLEDLSYDDIARALSVPKKSVDNAIGRIKAKLRKLL